MPGGLGPAEIGSILFGRFFFGGNVDGGGAKLPTGGMLLPVPEALACAVLLSGKNCLKSSKRSGAASKSLVT